MKVVENIIYSEKCRCNYKIKIVDTTRILHRERAKGREHTEESETDSRKRKG